VDVYREMDHCIITEWCGADIAIEAFAQYRDLTGDEFLYGFPTDPTLGIPDGDTMEEMVFRIADDPQGLHDELRRALDDALGSAINIHGKGGDVVWMGSDYAMNSGPFLSPAMFAEFVAPYLADFIKGCRASGLYVIKHTDGNIMPVLDQVAASAPHALHSIDTVAGMDIKVVREQVGDRLALIGNVPHGPLQLDQREVIEREARYCLEHGGVQQGGYIYSTSNAVSAGALTGITVEAYKFMLKIRDDYCRELGIG